jgi:dipeptidyl aminopeptidase/acylaminoacyl peptidase
VSRGATIGWLGLALLCHGGAAGAQAKPSSPVTVRDLIGMTLFGSDPHNGASEADAIARSPDGAHLAVLLQRGDLAANTLAYTLVVLRTADTRHQLRPDTMLTLTSASNDPAVSHVHWLADSRTLAFLGRRPSEPAQVYTVDIATRALAARTHSQTGITSFEIAPAGDPVIYQERQGTIDTSRYAEMRAHGFVLSRNEWLPDAMSGNWLGAKWEADKPTGYRIARAATDTPLRLPDSTADYKGCAVSPSYGPPLGPRADAVLLVCTPGTRHYEWNRYRNARYRREADEDGDSGSVLVLLDLTDARASLVFDAPVTDETNFAWAPDGQSIVVANALLPLDDPDSTRRLTQRMVAEVDLESRAIRVITPRDSLVPRNRDSRTGIMELAHAPDAWRVTSVSPRTYYRKTTHGWREVSPTTAAVVGPRYVIDQGPNTPPRLAIMDPKTGAPRVVFDPNPELLTAHRFGHVEVFHWTSTGGNAWAGGLYYPPDYVPGRRYPVVMQTHGYDSTRFAPEGAFTTDQAAQPLAGAGILVLQTAEQLAGDRRLGMDSPAEGPFDQALFEGAIDALDQRGLIDRTKVGMQGFSRTSYATLYFLTHSPYPVVAATVADGVDWGYLQYVAFFHNVGHTAEAINGGRPWGVTQSQWRERAPGFRLDRVTAPLRLTAIGWPGSLLEEWEPYAGLLLQGKPAEMVYIPEGAHILVKPWERLTSQQGVVDWWRFWLQGYEDPDPAKAEQYSRWRKLRVMRDSAPVSISR